MLRALREILEAIDGRLGRASLESGVAVLGLLSGSDMTTTGRTGFALGVGDVSTQYCSMRK